ncbi:MAG TPA: hypothetical protein VJA18_00365 [Candidatus Nanoarchaeia archaeon]|nr:hypothetical protein [Candidatus Nanoarchaeia archaeon]
METLQRAGTRTVEPIVLDNFWLDGEAERGADGEYLAKSHLGWEEHFAGLGKRLPTVQEYIVTLKHLSERDDSFLPGILQDLRESALCTGPLLNYRNSNIPLGDGYLDQLVKDSAWKNALQDEVLQYNVPEAADILLRVSGKRPYILTPSAQGREYHPEMAVWLYIDTDRFYLLCDNNPFNLIGLARGVREVGAAGARVGKSGSACRDPAMTEEQRLTARIEEELSRFDGFVGTYGQENYAKIKQEVAQNLKGLYKR